MRPRKETADVAGLTDAQPTHVLRLRGGPESAPMARRALARLAADLEPPVMEALRLLVTELVTNTVRHAGAGALELRTLVKPESVWVVVTDTGPGFDPDGLTGSSRRDGGFGLLLVERLADRGGVGRADGANRVWFELRR